jgi:hypothetical protein
MPLCRRWAILHPFPTFWVTLQNGRGIYHIPRSSVKTLTPTFPIPFPALLPTLNIQFPLFFSAALEVAEAFLAV